MKSILLVPFMAANLFFSAVNPTVAADGENLPPGLQKKDKLPPGWQKKQAGKKTGPAPAGTGENPSGTAPGSAPAPTPNANPNPNPSATSPAPQTSSGSGTTSPATKAPSSVPTTTPEAKAPASTTVSGKPLTKEQQQNLARMERALADLEAQAKRPGASDRLLHRLSNRQQVSTTVLQGQLKSNPGLTVPQLYLATLVGRESRTPVDKILAERREGTAWSEIIRSRKIQFSDMAERLRAAEEAAKEAARQEENRINRDSARK